MRYCDALLGSAALRKEDKMHPGESLAEFHYEALLLPALGMCSLYASL